MRTAYWFGLAGCVAALTVFACSSSDSSPTIGPGNSGSGGTVIGNNGGSGNGGSTSKGGSGNGGSTSKGGSGNGGSSNGGSSNGGSANGGSGGGSCDPSTQVKSSDCSSCAQAAQTGACKTQTSACGTDCQALIKCLNACTDATCETSCISQAPAAGAQQYDAFDGCIRANCHDQCFCPGCIFGGTAACNTCLATSCLSACNGCDENADCMALADCLQSCAQNDTACENNCAQANQAGVTPYNNFGTCGQNSCASQCQ
jgi:hypothetical protein